MHPQTHHDSLGFLLTDAARLLRSAFERRIAQAGLGITPAEARTLLNIQALGDCRQLELAARMGIEPMTVCTFLDKLQGLGLIDRQPDPADRRAKRVTLTAACEPLIETLRQELDVVLAVATAGMSPEEARMLNRALQRVSGNLQTDALTLPEAAPCS
ncbi:MarR family winged helix-turn-helix transcriptional regulator [Rhizobium sp. CSW-27]|uniref:MarR family winged helix-turn-helix transcriptional regulator n=1 Tax=Rhizobium sp. CSW-27 TaxID=2839985 RepID=UPI001C02B0FA|nr:MarR family winged helix-turn-helix transcriptional regulator [Rhizobium sp. CSW-27]MBT9370681.1 MarR family winged helix-turn-helix transcriptional regulator [Rhizobium sp. CSW-27]